LHERIRVHSVEAARQVKEHGMANDLLERIAGDASFDTTVEKLEAMLDPAKYTGRSKEQTEEFLQDHVAPVLARWSDWKDLKGEELRV
jgi:adenylosuccinate lyase